MPELPRTPRSSGDPDRNLPPAPGGHSPAPKAPAPRREEAGRAPAPRAATQPDHQAEAERQAAAILADASRAALPESSPDAAVSPRRRADFRRHAEAILFDYGRGPRTSADAPAEVGRPE